MIVPMSKVIILASEFSRDEAIAALRRLGVLDVESVRSPVS